MGNCQGNNGPRCGKCDGRHVTEQCKVYPKPRESHPDARPHTPSSGAEKDVMLREAVVVRQPADNHCLYHALSHGLKKKKSPPTLRKELSGWVLANQQVDVKGRKLIEWLKEEYPNEDSEQYAELMKSSMRWGGLPELTGCSVLYCVNIRIWERKKSGFRLLSNFPAPEVVEQTIDLLYNRGRSHYDTLVIPSSNPLHKPLPSPPESPLTASDVQPIVDEENHTDKSPEKPRNGA